MCISAWPTEFSSTITGTWEVLVEDRLHHVLWYQNRVGGKRGSMHPAGVALPPFMGNCLIIPLLGKWDSIRLLNTMSAPSLLLDVQTAMKAPAARGVDLEQVATASWGGSGGGMVFMKFDIYDIVIAENAVDIPAVLDQIVPEKRPRVNDDVFQLMNDWYGCPVAVCCFNDVERGESKPLAFAFEPLYPSNLVVYTFDGHDGRPPDPKKIVHLDHTIFVGSYLTDANQCGKIRYSDNIAVDLKPYVLRNAMRIILDDVVMENGDFVFQTKAVRAGHFEGFRGLPPKAPPGIMRLGHSVKRHQAYAIA